MRTCSDWPLIGAHRFSLGWEEFSCVTCISDGLFVFAIALEDRDIQNHTKHLTDINSEVVNVQADLKV